MSLTVFQTNAARSDRFSEQVGDQRHTKDSQEELEVKPFDPELDQQRTLGDGGVKMVIAQPDPRHLTKLSETENPAFMPASCVAGWDLSSSIFIFFPSLSSLVPFINDSRLPPEQTCIL